MVRITGGSWRGRRLEVPRGIRPTTELARKAAFDILGDTIRGARVLDACAGSGAYGLEALSRGAAHATFVEADRKAAEVLRGNVDMLRAGDRCRIEERSVERFASKGEGGRGRGAGEAAPGGGEAGARFSSNDEEGRGRRARPAARGEGGARPLLPSKKFADRGANPGVARFDVIFHDPPFKEISPESDLQRLLSLVRPGGWLIHERGDDAVLAPGGFAPADRRRYGLTRLLIYRP
jgi:16S rRNA G966 N2-methylase RsmD